MKHFVILCALLSSLVAYGQPILPFYYEQNLPLYGKPIKVGEYYYEYHTQAKAHYYDHTMVYDAEGRIKTHVKTNQGLLHPDSIPLPFKDIIDTRPVTITYSFTYDAKDRLQYFVRHLHQEEVGEFQQDEEWKYDTQDMLVEHNFWTITGNDTALKNPSTRRAIYRDPSQKVQKIEKSTYSFSEKGLVVSEMVEYAYRSGQIDTISTYTFPNGQKILRDKKYNLSFARYNALNTDAILFASYTAVDNEGVLTTHSFAYDTLQRMTQSLVLDSANDTIAHTVWEFESFKTTEKTAYLTWETYFDETGYERYHEEFMGGHSLAVPSERNTRSIENGRIKHALMEVWDPVTYFYRKDTEYLYYYELPNSLISFKQALPARKIYPNPTSGSLHIDNVEGIRSLQLISSDGQTRAIAVNTSLQLGVPPGLYLLQATFQDGSLQRTKVVIE